MYIIVYKPCMCMSLSCDIYTTDIESRVSCDVFPVPDQTGDGRTHLNEKFGY